MIDVNTGRFVGSRSKSSGARLEDTVTKNNLEAVKEVVRQLRLRDIGGIIVIDFIDMANPKNREAVEQALQQELERDRTKTYVVEISPLGLVEMTRQNVTDGPREILTRKCPTCAGEGVVVSEATAVVDAERRLRTLVASKPRTRAFKVELNAHVAELLIGPGAMRLQEIEASTRRRLFLVGKAGVPHEHFAVLEEGTVEKLAPVDPPVAEGQTVELKLVEVGRHDAGSAVGKLDGISVAVGGAARLVGKKVSAHVERVLDGVAYATLAGVEAAGVRGRSDHGGGPGGEADPRIAGEEAGSRSRVGRGRSPRPTSRSTPSPSPTPMPSPSPSEVAEEAEDQAEADVSDRGAAEEEDSSRLPWWTGTEEGDGARRAQRAAEHAAGGAVRSDHPRARAPTSARRRRGRGG